MSRDAGTAVAPFAAAPSRAVTATRVTNAAFAAAVFSITFEQLRWHAGTAGHVRLFDLLALVFVAAFGVELLLARERSFGRVETTLAAFGVALALAYLAGAVALDSEFSRIRFARGIATFAIHFALLTAGVAYLVRRPPRFYRLAFAFLFAGMAVSAAYAALQLAVAKAGVNLDHAVLSPLTGEPARSLWYAQEGGPRVLRARGLTTDPNHLGIMLLVPLLVLPPLATRLPPRRRTLLGILLAGLLVVLAATLSRSAALGLLVGLVILLAYDRRAVLSRALLIPAASAAVLLLAFAARDPHFYRRVLSARLNPHGEQKGMPGHLALYDFIPRTLHSHPLFGIGLDNFSGFYSSIARDYGPLSFYVQSLVETGIVGTAIFAALLGYAFLRLRELSRPPAAGLTAALVATMAANALYLTMTFAYFYVFLALVFAAALVLARER